VVDGGPESGAGVGFRRVQQAGLKTRLYRQAGEIDVNSRMGIAAVIAAVLLGTMLQRLGSRPAAQAGFWYEEFPFTFSEGFTAALGGPLTDAEIAAIKRISRAELEHAFSGLNVGLSDSRDAFWRVRVRQSLDRKRGQRLPNAGETMFLGPFGARSEVNFLEVVAAAIAHAPPGASRQTLIEGIARGTGRAAAHELAHAILGTAGAMDNSTDANSYEYFTHNRPSQFYGELHWSDARALQQTVGGWARSSRAPT
jgi:hypothetical protein